MRCDSLPFTATLRMFALLFTSRAQDNILDKQLQESWQGTWTAQDISVDSKDRYTIRVLGRQDIHRLDNGATVDDPRQLSLSLKLIADPKGRADRNLRSGFLISSFDYKEIQ
jgi:hypothetical protein